MSAHVCGLVSSFRFSAGIVGLVSKKRTHDKAVQQPDETDMCGCKRSQTSYIYIGAEWKWMCRYGVNVWLCLTFWQTDTERYVRCPDPYWLHSFNVTRPISSHGICLESRIISYQYQHSSRFMHHTLMHIIFLSKYTWYFPQLYIHII